VIPIQRLYRANVVVHDLRATARQYAKLLGIKRWEVVHCTSARLSVASAYGYAADYAYSTATGSNANGVTFRLIQPTSGFSTFTEFLITRGEGVHSVCTTVLDDEAELTDLARLLRKEGVAIGQAAMLDGAVRQVFFDTRMALGGFLIEVTGGSESAIAADEVWDFSNDTQPNALHAITRIGHFGVAVPNLMQRLPVYERLLGLERWNAVHFQPEHSTLNGERVEHAFLLAIGSKQDVTFELLQSTRGPTDYISFQERTGGPGIHHMLLLRDLPEDEWLALRATLDLPAVMSGRVRSGVAEFYYVDTRSKLGGWLVEVIVSRAERATTPPDPLGRFTLDFSRRDTGAGLP